MQQLILTSVIIATFLVPAYVSRRPGGNWYPRVLKPFVAYVAVYVLLLLFVYPRLF